MRALITGAILLALLQTTAAHAGSLENLERERAIMIQTLLDPSVTPQDRQGRIASSSHRLVDLERMVLRDRSLVGENTPVVRKAFQNYDLTFLVHSATEKDLLVIDHWMEQVGLTTHNLMSARVGRR